MFKKIMIFFGLRNIENEISPIDRNLRSGYINDSDTTVIHCINSKENKSTIFSAKSSGRKFNVNINGVDQPMCSSFEILIDGLYYKKETGGLEIRIDGDIEDLKSTSGDVNVKGSVKSVQTTSGNVRVEKSDIVNLVKTTSGDVIVNGSISNASTVSGNISKRWVFEDPRPEGRGFLL